MPLPGTKVHVPTPRRRLAQRARLLGRLEARAGLMPRLVLVSAPAGFGKTTLLTQWLSQAGTSQRRLAWLALDPGDADPVVFLTHSGSAGVGRGKRDGDAVDRVKH